MNNNEKIIATRLLNILLIVSQNGIFHDNGQVLHKNRVQGENPTLRRPMLLYPIQTNRGVYAIKNQFIPVVYMVTDCDQSVRPTRVVTITRS